MLWNDNNFDNVRFLILCCECLREGPSSRNTFSLKNEFKIRFYIKLQNYQRRKSRLSLFGKLFSLRRVSDVVLSERIEIPSATS